MEYSVDLDLIRRVLLKMVDKHWSRFCKSQEQEEADKAAFYGCIVLGLCPKGILLHFEILHNLGVILYQQYTQWGRIEDLNRTIELHRAALELCPKSHSDHSTFLNNLADTLHIRSERCQRISDLDEAVDHYRTALTLRLNGHSNLSTSLGKVAASLQTRFEQSGQSSSPDEAIGLHCSALDLWCNPEHLHQAALCLQARFKERGEDLDLEDAILLHRSALKLLPNNHRDRDVHLGNLAFSLRIRFQQYGQIVDLNEAVKHYHAILELRPEGHPGRSVPLVNLGCCLRLRFLQHEQTEDINNSIDHYRAALQLLPDNRPNDPNYYGFLNDLANSLQTRFERTGQIADLNEAIENRHAALGHCPNDHPRRLVLLTNLAASLNMRFGRHKQTTDLDEAIKLLRTVLEHYPNGHLYRSVALVHLAASLNARFEQCGQAMDLDEAIEIRRSALRHHPIGHPSRSSSLSNLASSLRTRFEQFGVAADLNEAIEYHRAALDQCPNIHPDRSMRLNNLAVSLKTRFEQYGQAADLDEAVEHLRTALELCPGDHPERYAALSNLDNSLQLQFRQYGRTASLDEAIAHHRTALERLPDSHPNRSTALNNLATSLCTRFERKYEQPNQVQDLNDSIKLYRSALEHRPFGHPGRSHSLSNLAGALQTRFIYRQTLGTMFADHLAAMGLWSSAHPESPSIPNVLSGSLHTQSKQYGQTTDIDEAIELHYSALELRPVGHPDRSSALNNLAGSLKYRFEHSGETTDINKAVEHYHAALELYPAGHPGCSKWLVNLARSLLSRFEKLGLMDDIEECIQSLECATLHEFSSLVNRLEAACLWANVARSHSHHTTSRAYQKAMLLLQRALVVSPTLHAQHDFLDQKHRYGSFALDIVAHAVEGNRLEEAIELLEQGRGLLWSQMRSFRTPLDRLAETNRELAERFRDIIRQLENLTTSSSVPQSISSSVESGSSILTMAREQKLFEEKIKLKERLSNEQEEITREIRRIPGFENFLEATPFKELQRAASEGPVIVVNHSQYRSDALIILPHGDRPVVCVPLDGEFYKDIIMLYSGLVAGRTGFGVGSQEYDRILCQTMKTLWDRVVIKVVDKLKELGIVEGSRIWWCPTSVLSALPFHAAGPFEDTEGTTMYLLDKYISSYTPTLGALIDAQLSRGKGGAPTTLVIGDTSLPSAKEEIRRIKNCGVKTKLLSSGASHNAVVEALRKTTWVHFACHGGLDPKPFDSAFKVSDRGLTLLDIVQANIPNAEFAFLSACHTAEQHYSSIHDEVLHLAAAIQFSGFRSVIGSMWELLDEDGPFFARTVYEYMCNCDEDQEKYKQAAAGLREAAIKLKARDGIRTERWVNLVHTGA
ncbi:uncharacterized protein FOMMEDRAFT_162602 [Fomitiporia mediterranea MF3/22]|uniref:CHAT domain-containing protein n=1 Tax=Fomitiporia mediterranea (strain MF3/22) TaxID=694068 RepID=R7SGG2_FOMME|nr:uncharacterized protein FOMMEDRAFT_162602 [Fomitiporia mediterranea MF3/22]EJC97783.1 hypothetical protein FOMMEDRAFT_162602 [Fomitiporia mediterranea MF3/22]